MTQCHAITTMLLYYTMGQMSKQILHSTFPVLSSLIGCHSLGQDRGRAKGVVVVFLTGRPG